jgi:hypothetical protein
MNDDVLKRLQAGYPEEWRAARAARAAERPARWDVTSEFGLALILAALWNLKYDWQDLYNRWVRTDADAVKYREDAERWRRAYFDLEKKFKEPA